LTTAGKTRGVQLTLPALEKEEEMWRKRKKKSEIKLESLRKMLAFSLPKKQRAFCE
jgi:hypothetical protein